MNKAQLKILEDIKERGFSTNHKQCKKLVDAGILISENSQYKFAVHQFVRFSDESGAEKVQFTTGELMEVADDDNFLEFDEWNWLQCAYNACNSNTAFILTMSDAIAAAHYILEA